MKTKKYSITATANKETKTFDITKTWNDGTVTTYRTGELSEEEFEELDYNTESDWADFLRTDQSYYVVKYIALPEAE